MGYSNSKTDTKKHFNQSESVDYKAPVTEPKEEYKGNNVEEQSIVPVDAVNSFVRV